MNIKYIYILLLMCLLGASVASAQGGRYDSMSLGPRGPIANAYIAVCIQPANVSTAPCSTLATLYTDATLTTPCTGTLVVAPSQPSQPCSNPMLSDALGNYHFYAAAATPYTVQVYGPQVNPPFLMYDQVVSTASQSGATIAIFTCTSDIGAVITAAYAALPSTGGVIRGPGGTCPMSSIVNFTTTGKPVLLDLNGGTINFTPTTNLTAFTLSYGAAAPTFLMNQGITNGILINNNCISNGGCGSLATGIVTGTTPGVGPNFSNLTIRGFGIGMSAQGGGSNSWGAIGDNTTFIQNTTGLIIGNPYENFSVYAAKFVSNGTHVSYTGATTDMYAFGTSFDAATTVGISNGGGGLFEAHGCHFENSNGVGGGLTTHYINSAGGQVSIFGGDWLDDQTTGNTDYWILTTGAVTIDGATFFSAGRTATQVVEVDSPGYGHVEYTNNSAGVLTSFVGGTAAASVTAFENNSQKTTAGANGSTQFNGAVKGNNIPIVTSFTTTAATSDNVTVTGMTSSGHCSLQPTNAAADTLLTGTYVSAKTTNQITVTHAATSGGTFDVMCTPN